MSIELHPRKISLGCSGLVGEGTDGVQCPECVKLRDDGDGGGGKGETEEMAAEEVRQSEPIDLVSDGGEDKQDIQIEDVKTVTDQLEEDGSEVNAAEEPVSEEKEVDEAIEKLTSSLKPFPQISLPEENHKEGSVAEEEADDPSEENVLALPELASKSRKQKDSSFLCRSCNTSFSGSEKHVCALRAPFLCTLCFKSFRSETSLKLHRNSVHEFSPETKLPGGWAKKLSLYDPRQSGGEGELRYVACLQAPDGRFIRQESTDQVAQMNLIRKVTCDLHIQIK